MIIDRMAIADTLAREHENQINEANLEQQRKQKNE